MQAQESRARRFVKIVIVLAAIPLVGMAVLVWARDPFGRLDLNKDRDQLLHDPNVIGGDTGLYAKELLAHHIHFDAIMIGSSKMMYIDPSDLKGYTFFNASLSAMMPETMYEVLNLFAKNIRVVVLGLDFFMLNEAEFPLVLPDQIRTVHLRVEEAERPASPLRVARWGTENLSYLLSAKAALRAWEGPRTPPSDTRMTERGNINLAATTENEEYWRSRCILGADHQKYADTLDNLRRAHYQRFTYSEPRLRTLRQIRDLLQHRGVALEVTINPVHPEDRNLIHELGLDDQFERYRRDMKTIFPDAVDLTSSNYAVMSKYFSWDVTHFLPSAGAEFVNKLLDGTLADEASGVEPDSAERRAELSALTAERTTIDFKPLAPGARPDERTGESVISWTSQQNGQAKALGPTVEVTFEKPQRVWTLELEKTDDEKSQQFYVRIENEIDGHWPNTVPRSHCALGKRTKFVLPESVPARHWRITTVGPDGSLPDVHHWVTQLTFRSTPGQ